MKLSTVHVVQCRVDHNSRKIDSRPVKVISYAWISGVFPKCFHWIQQIQWQNICHQKGWTCHHLCKRPEFYHSTSKTHVRHWIFKLSPIHASMIYQILWIQEFNESFAPFRKNPSLTIKSGEITTRLMLLVVSS